MNGCPDAFLEAGAWVTPRPLDAVRFTLCWARGKPTREVVPFAPRLTAPPPFRAPPLHRRRARDPPPAATWPPADRPADAPRGALSSGAADCVPRPRRGSRCFAPARPAHE